MGRDGSASAWQIGLTNVLVVSGRDCNGEEVAVVAVKITIVVIN